AVAGVAGAIGYRVALRRRRDRLRAGQLLLSVMRFPITGNRRKWTVWGLTAAVILDGVVMSVLVLPAAPLFDSQDDFPPMLGFAVQVVLVQAILWCACLDGWTYDVALGFHEHGLLTKERFYAWTTISRIQWTSPQLAVYGEHSLIVGIDPADFQSVTGVLEIIRQRTGVPITSE
ncbi:MAG TPA: hypothetical protein VFB80_14405, partial [Pirellulaceae bacterium]|nr:hypothetical protein [Pirellulaceae bacterium]